MLIILLSSTQTKEDYEKENSLKDQDASSSSDSKSSSRESSKTGIPSSSTPDKTEEVTSPTKHRISGGIQALMSKLNLVRPDTTQRDNMISPLDIDLYCNSNTGEFQELLMHFFAWLGCIECLSANI